YRESQTLGREGRELIKQREVQTALPLRDAVAEARGAGLLRSVDPDLLAEDMTLLAHGWALKHWYFAPRVSIAGYVTHHRAAILSGIVADQHRADYADLLGDLA